MTGRENQMTIETYVNAVIDSCMAIFCAFAAVYTIVKRKKDPKASLMMFWSLMAGMVFSASEALAFFSMATVRRRGMS